MALCVIRDNWRDESRQSWLWATNSSQKSNRLPPRFKLTLEPGLASPCLIEFRINCFCNSLSSRPGSRGSPFSLCSLLFFSFSLSPERIRLCHCLSSGRCVERRGSPYFPRLPWNCHGNFAVAWIDPAIAIAIATAIFHLGTLIRQPCK